MDNAGLIRLEFAGEGQPMEKNNVKRIRESKMLSKSELAKLAGISPLTLDRIERGKQCRMATKRKILLALGLKLSERNKVFRQ